MIHQETKWGAGSGSSGLVPVQIIEQLIQKESHSSDDKHPRRSCYIRLYREIWHEVPDDRVGHTDEHKSRHRDDIWRKCQWKEVDDASTQRFPHVLVDQGLINAVVLVLRKCFPSVRREIRGEVEIEESFTHHTHTHTVDLSLLFLSFWGEFSLLNNYRE